MNLRRRLSTLIAVRLIVSTLLLGSAILFQLNRPGALPSDPFFFLISLTYALSFLYLATLRYAERHRWLVDLQFAADAIELNGRYDIVITDGGKELVRTGVDFGKMR